MPSAHSPDTLFRNATIITGAPSDDPYISSVLVSGGLIAAISPDVNPHSLDPSTRIIDASGLYLCPGFIDLHAHSDLYLLTHGAHEAKLSQGVTTEVIGQDGIAYAPVNTGQQMQAIRDQIAGWNGNPSDGELQRLKEEEGISGLFEWRSVGDYLNKLEECGVATNVAMLVPQGNLRLLTCGPDDVPATSEQIEAQTHLLRRSMDEGAIGMSSGLTYTPGMYASTSELATLCRVLAGEYPGSYYAPHHRSYGLNALESYAEMLHLSSETKCPLHLTHATLNFPPNKGKAPELLCMIDRARSDGCDISLDTYPYLPGCTTLAALLPSWASAGGPAMTLQRLEDEAIREKILVAMEVEGCDGGHGVPVDWDTIQVGTCSDPSITSYSARTIAEIAKAESTRPIDIYFGILRADRLATTCLMHIGHEANVQAIMKHGTHCGGTDAILHGECTHPRGYGTFPRFIGHYARDLGLMSIPEMISHLTYRPAKRMGIWPHRGLIAIGSAADLVLFDPEKILDMATFDKPKRVARGIEVVMVNGEIVFEQGRMLGKKVGRVLRRKEDGRVD